MGKKKLNVERDFELIDKVIRGAFEQMLGRDIQDAVIKESELNVYVSFCGRIANFLFNYTKMSQEEVEK